MPPLMISKELLDDEIFYQRVLEAAGLGNSLDFVRLMVEHQEQADNSDALILPNGDPLPYQRKMEQA